MGPESICAEVVDPRNGGLGVMIAIEGEQGVVMGTVVAEFHSALVRTDGASGLVEGATDCIGAAEGVMVVWVLLT